MSKILEDLKHPESKHFQEELAKTYFSTPPPKKESPYNYSSSKKKEGFFLGLISALTLTIIIIISSFIYNKPTLNRRVNPSWKMASTAQGPSKTGEIIYLNNNGEVNTDIIKGVVFYENADTLSSWGRELVVLSNEIASKKTGLGIDFKKPMNLTDKIFGFYARGKNGGETLKICLKDSQGNYCYSKVNKLQDAWQQFIITAEAAKEFIDPENVTRINLEVNPDEEEYLSPSTVYFKDLYLEK